MLNKLLLAYRAKDSFSKNLYKNSFLIFFFRGISILSSFLMIRLSMNYLDSTSFGIWLTLVSIVSWISFMDMGMGNGLRNKLTESIVETNIQLAKEYVSTTYFFFGIFISLVICIFLTVNSFLDWQAILNSKDQIKDIKLITAIMFSSFCIRLLLNLSGVIVTAYHRPFLNGIAECLIGLISVLSVYVLSKSDSSSLLSYSIIISCIPILIFSIFTVVIFRLNRFKTIRPSLAYIDRSHISSLFGVGTRFFMIQIAAMLIFASDNIIISQLFAPTEVTVYNIAYKYFSIITIIFNMFLLPYWSAFTEAFQLKNTIWIKNTIKSLIIAWAITTFLGLIACIVAPTIYSYWIGKTVQVPPSLNVSLFVFCTLSNWNAIYATFLNGISKIKIQLYTSVIIAFINIPLAYVLTRLLCYDISMVVVSNIICLSLFGFLGPIQTYRILSNKSRGIWNS